MKRKVFTIDCFAQAYIGYTDGYLWNGWATPAFELAEAKRVAEGFNECAEFPLQYDEVYDQFYILDTETSDLETWKGIDVPTDDGIKHLYSIGAYSWVWDAVGKSDIRSIAQEIEEFIFFHDTYNYHDEYGIEREKTVESLIQQFADLDILAKAISIMRNEHLNANQIFQQLGEVLKI